MVVTGIDAIRRARNDFPDRVALRFLDYSSGAVAVRSRTYQRLWDEAAVAALAALADVEGWRRSTTGPFRSWTVPGGHFYLSDSPILATRCLTDLIRSRRATNHQ